MKLSVQTFGTLEIIGLEAGMKAIADAGFDALDFGLDGFYKWNELTSGQKCAFFEDENFVKNICYFVKFILHLQCIRIQSTIIKFKKTD